MIKINREEATLEGDLNEVTAEWVVCTMTLWQKLRDLGNEDESIEGMFKALIEQSAEMMD